MLPVYSSYAARQQLVENVKRNCVFVPLNHPDRLTELKLWCTNTIGFECYRHPILDAQEFGSIDYDDGVWAMIERSEIDQYQAYTVVWNFWFRKFEHMVMFKLTHLI